MSTKAQAISAGLDTVTAEKVEKAIKGTALTWADLLALLQQYGPVVWQIVLAIMAILNRPPAPTPGPTPTK